MGRIVLIVDDSALNRKLVAKSLPAGFAATLVHAGNGAEALEQLSRITPHLIFLDLNMPVMDGYQMLETLYRAGVAHPPIIVLSADVQPKARERVLGLGALAFLSKPPSSEAMQRAIVELGLA